MSGRCQTLNAKSFASKNSHAITRRFLPNKPSMLRLAAVAVGVFLIGIRPAVAANYYWFGDDNNFWNTTVGPGGSNWSSSGSFNNGTGGATALPSSTSDVFFVLSGANNLNTELGANFSINSLTFTPDATNAVQISDTAGGHLLTIGAGGITDNGPNTYTINAAVGLGGSETWTNNSPNALTFNGIISGAAANNLTIAGSGVISLGGENTYSGSTTVFTGTLRVSGAGGSIRASSGVTLGAGTTLTLDSTGGNEASQDRIGNAVTITSKGGFINLLGNSLAATTETVGQLATAPGATYVTVTPGGVQTATLTLGGAAQSITHAAPGGTVTFSSTGTIMAPNQPLVNTGIPANAIIGGWATIGSVKSTVSNTLDWATVSGGQVVPLAAYQPLTALPAATDNAQGSAATDTVTLAGSGTNSYTVNTLSFKGSNYGLKFTNNTDKITIGAGGIFCTDATGTGNYDNKAATPNMTFVGSPDSGAVNVGGTVAYNGHITSSFFPTATTSELDVFTTATGNLRLYSIIDNPDANHPLTLVKSGPGLLDLSGGNTQNNKTSNTFSGKVVINEGVLLINTAGNLGPNPGSFVADQVSFNGGELRTFAGLTPNGNGGWTVGTRGGTFTYTGGGSSTISNKITGVGGFTFYSRAFGGGTNEIINLGNASSNNDYQGPTNIWISLDTAQGQFGRIAWTVNNQIPSTSAVTMSIVDDTPAHTQVTNANTAGNPASVDFTGRSDHFGSLAGNLNIRGFTGTLTLGANNLSTVYTGSIYGAATQAAQADTAIQAGSGTLVKVGTGTQTFGGGRNNYTGPTNINGGKLLIGNGTSLTDAVAVLGTGTVNVGNGAAAALGGNGTITGPVIVNGAGGTLAPAMSATTFNTLTINNNLTINAGGALSYNFASPGGGPLNTGAGSGDLTTVIGTGNLSIPAGADVLNVNQLTGFGLGTYPLITLTGTGTFTDAATFTVNGKANFNYAVLKPGDAIDASLGGGTVPANNLWLEVLQGNPQLTWIGNLSNVWDINTTANWAGDNTKFTTGSNVNFNDFSTGGHNNPVSVVAGGVNPNSMSIDGSGVASAGQDFTFSGGPITVTTTITKNQAGSVTFNNNVTTPITTVTSGLFTVGATSTYNSSAKFDLNGGSLVVNGVLSSPALTVASGTNLTVAAAGLLGSNTFLSNSDTAIFNQPAQTLTGIGGAGALTLNGTALTLTSGVSNYSGAIGGTGLIQVNGATANVTLSGNNSYGGGTSVTAGVLRAGSLTAFGTNPSLTISGTGTLDINGQALNGSVYTNVSVGGAGVGGNGAIINNGASQDNALLNVTMTAPTTFGGTGRWIIRPTGNLLSTLNGGGFDLTKTGTNTVGIATTNALVTGVKNININQGTVIVADNSTVDNTVAGSIFLNSAGTLSLGNYGATTGVVINKPIVMAGGALQTDTTGANGNATLAVPISLNATGNVKPQSGSTLTLNGAIANGTSSTSGITYAGTGTVVLGAASSYGGPTSINGATVRTTAGDNTLPTATSLSLNSGTLDLSGHNQQVASLAGAGGTLTTSVAGASTLTVTGNATTTYGGPIRNGAGTVSLVQTGTGSLTLNGASTFSGGTVINSGGTVVAQGVAGNPLGTGPVSINGGTLVIGPNGSGVTGFSGGTNWTVNNTTITSAAFPSAETLQLTDDAANEARTAFFKNQVAVNTSFTASFVYTPSHNPDLSSAADGMAFILQRDTRGTAALGGNGGNLGYGGITPSVGAEFNLYGPNAVGISLQTNGTIAAGGTYTPTAPVNLVSGDPIAVTINYNANTLTWTETLTDATANTTYSQQFSVDLAGTIAANTAFVGFSGGTGGAASTQQISNFSFGSPSGPSYSNAVSIAGGMASTINVAATGGVPVISMGNLTVGSGGTTTLNVAPAASAPANQAYGLTLGATSLSSNLVLNVSDNGSGAGTLTLGAVSDGGGNKSITLNGGTLALTAAGTYGGPTNINTGTLRVSNVGGSATGTGAVTLAANTTLAGTGAIGGSLIVAGGAHVAPGLGAGAIGTLTLATTNLNSNTNLDLDLGAVSTDAVHAGPLTLGANLNVDLNALAGFPIGTYTLVTSTGITGSPTFTVGHTGPGDIYPAAAYVVSKQGNKIVLNINVLTQTWTNTAGTGLWNTTDHNWTGAGGGIYADNSFNQVFDDSAGAANSTVTVSPNAVSPLGVLFANNAVPYTIATGSAAINGNGVVVIQGPGVVNLNSSNGYSGGTNILGGTVNIGDTVAFGSGPVTIAGGAIDNTTGFGGATLGNNFVLAGSFTFIGTNNLDLGSGNVTLTATPTITVAAGVLRMDGTIGDGGSGFGFTKDGPGELQLVGSTNTYNGPTTLANGTLTIAASATLGGGSAPLVVNGGTLNLNGSTQNLGPVTITGGSIFNGTLSATAFNINVAADYAIDSSVSLAGPGMLTKTGAGTLTLAGTTNTYAGGTTIVGSTVSIAADVNLGAPATLTLDGGTLLVTAGTATNAAAGTATLSAGRGITLSPNGGTISIGFVDTVTPGTAHLNSEIAVVYNGVITGPGGLTVIGQAGIDQQQQSILNLGSVATYQGNTTINNAIVEVNSGATGTTATGANPLVNVLPTGTVLNLINHGAWNIDSSTSSLTVAGLIGDDSGRFGTANQGSFATLTIGGSGNYAFPGIIGPFTVAGKLGNLDRLGLIMNGTGTQTLSGLNTYAGGTTVTSGTLTTTASGSIGSATNNGGALTGFLTVSAADTITSVMNIGNNQTIAYLSGTRAGSGTARVNVAAGMTLTDAQTTATTYGGSIGLAAGATPHSGGTFRTTGAAGSLETQSAPNLGNNSNINVTNTSTLKFNVTTGSAAVVGTGVLATVSDSAVLELSGSVSALSQPNTTGRVDVLNNSGAAAGLHVTGTSQQVGGVDGTGTTKVEASSNLTANHIVQAALVIAGDATHNSTVTIAASDSSGNPLAASGGLAVAGSLGSGAPLGTSDVLSGGAAGFGTNLGGSTLGSVSLGGATAAVPEPSTLLLAMAGVAAAFGLAVRRSRGQR